MTGYLTYCGQFAKDNDPDRLFLSLLTGNPADLWPLLAFNAEISRTREVVTETTIGLIRLQWWRDAIAGIYEGNILQHEVVTDLARIIKAYDLPREEFDNLVYAREFDLEDVLPATLEGLVNYADYTHAPLLRLIGRVAGEGGDMRSLAIAYTLTGLLRAVPYHARQHRCYLPQDVLADHDMNMALFYDMKPQSGVKGVITTVASAASRYLGASVASGPYTRGMRKMTSLYLKHISSCEFDPLSPGWGRSPAFRELRVAWASRF